MVLVIIVTCILLGIANVPLASGEPKIAKDNCTTQCGNVSIPFPFGIGADCSFNKWFEIFCDSSTTPHRPLLKNMQDRPEVIGISDFYLDDLRSIPSRRHDVQIKSPIIFFNCSDNKTRNVFDFTGTPFGLSSLNMLVALSCGILVKLNSTSENMSSQIWCKSTCLSSSNNYSLCDGIDCCETSIDFVPRGAFEIVFENSTNTGLIDQDLCGIENERKFAFIVDSDYWNNHKNDSRNFAGILDVGYVPVTLIWYISDADVDMIFGRDMKWSPSNNKSQYCFNNTYFSDYGSAWEGIQCFCKGLSGNPYLNGGCIQDINECKINNYRSPINCGRWGTCVNTYGSYDCSYKQKFILIGVGSGLGVLFLLFAPWGSYKFIKKRIDLKRKRNFFKRNGGLLLQQQLSSSEGNVEKTKLFSSNELQKATDNFSRDRVLGQGGQGTVYKGMLEEGKIVAIKKSKMVDEAQLSEFINEVIILSQINHRNVVQLLGCCLETEIPLLVYEFISNGTLSRYIHERNEDFPFTWKMRLRVAMEVAGALFYLHSAASFPIYHRDIKSTNILLDEKYRAKVADFGTSRTISLEQTHLTTIVYGTFGYLDPEYFQLSQFTEKSDVYSFGVVLVELLTGKKAIFVTRSGEGANLATYFNTTMEEENVFDIVDPQVLEDAPKEEIIQISNLAYRCLNLNGRNRPTMKEVAVELERTQKLERASIVQQNHGEIEYVRTEFFEPWDVPSTSVVSSLDKTASTRASLVQELPLLSFKSH